MPRVKKSVASRARKKKILKAAKGYRGMRGSTYKLAKEAVIRAGVYAYRDRKVNKRNFRSLWIVRINAAARLNGLSYSALINGLVKAKVEVNRKILADLAVNDPNAFTKIAETAKAALN